MSVQDQFLDVVDRDVAASRFHGAMSCEPLGKEYISVRDSLGRVLATDVVSRIDVPAFDRSNLDGFAVQSQDTFGASESSPRQLQRRAQSLDAGTPALLEIASGEAVAIATGGMVPRGANAILMIEHSEVLDDTVRVQKAVTPGFGISYAGTDIALGETVLRAGLILTSRETGVLAAMGESMVEVWRKPRVRILSTGNEIIAPGESLRAASTYDSNSQVLADAVREQGGIAEFGGIIPDDLLLLQNALESALIDSDMVLFSGGTSKGQGDLCFQVLAKRDDPGIVVHGVALKPGKPICMAVTQGKPVVVLPGFPTSAIFTFHEFVAPVIRLLAGLSKENEEYVPATMAIKTNSEIGRTEYLLVGLVKSDSGLTAFPMGKGSGSVTTFSRADGFVTIPKHTEILDQGQSVSVRLMGRRLELADLVVMGSHCIGLDYLITELQRRGVHTKLMTIGSSAGLVACERGECDIAGVHLWDRVSGTFNRPFLTDSTRLIEGYTRSQGFVFRDDDPRFVGRTLAEMLSQATNDSSIVMVNRNQGSGTRILIDHLLDGKRPKGYEVQPTNHNAVIASICQHRADWGMAIQSLAVSQGLGFTSVHDEQFDFIVRQDRLSRRSVQAFIELLSEDATQSRLRHMGFGVSKRLP